MRHVAAELHRRAPALLFASALAASVVSCGGVRSEGLGVPGPPDAGRPAAVDARPPDAATISTPLPGSGPKSLAAWTCSGGGALSNESVYLGVQIGGVAGGSVSAPNGSRVTLGHFADTVE